MRVKVKLVKEIIKKSVIGIQLDCLLQELNLSINNINRIYLVHLLHWEKDVERQYSYVPGTRRVITIYKIRR